jgi:hypothetical protein
MVCPEGQIGHFELELKDVSVPKDGDGFLGLQPEGQRSRRKRTAEFSKTCAAAGA